MYTDPNFWTTTEDHIRTIGIMGMLGVFAWVARMIWKARGTFDDFVASQKSDRELAQKTFAEIETAKKIALETVEAAKAHGAERASVILAEVQTLDKNHLSHIEAGINGLNTTQNRLVEMQGRHLEIATDMKESLAILRDRTAETRKSRK